MRGYPLHLLLSVGVLWALAVLAERLGFAPPFWVPLGALAYGAFALYGLRFGLRHALLLLGLLAPWFPWAAFLVPLAFALLFGRRMGEREQAAFYGWALVWPALALLLVWQVFPTFYAFYLSLFEKVNFLRPAAFAGLENYQILLRDPLFWRASGNTFWYVLFTVPTGLLLATAIAILLNTGVAFQGFYRTLYFLPYITALTAAAAVWRWIYHPEFGFLNWLLGTPGLDWLNTPTGVFALLLRPLGLEPQGFWAGPSLAFVAVMAMSVWHFLGYQVVILLAGLQAIPKEYYEAAELDGASFWQQHRLITWPLLSPTTFFLFTLGIIGAFQVFTQVYVLTPTGGVLQDTLTLAFYLYNKGFRDSDFSYASAIAMVTFLIILVLTLVQRRILERRVNYEI
ncbi:MULTISPECIES: carbohydrate ABC transporter permease [Thermus]|jgi:multiple sugar transport system permease protein|uniref:ABC transporter permease n=1 Tax=Thermus brockianus TaxID=56956 RepID=A0A1J0LV68_THEBO|nr:sugar ABC transporter permease [Thermus brockianus]APD09900.1 ABC transporter permease [Thermus brockianus]